MTDRPILYSTPMVRACIEDRKTQTRRVIRPYEPALSRRTTALSDLIAVKVPARHGGWMAGPTFRLRFAVGDRLWVREAHAIYDAHGQHRSDDQRWGPWGGLPTRLSPDRSQIAYFREGFDRSGSIQWRPSIHMPRWASRLTQIVTQVRVERLHDITETDAIAEGPGFIGKITGEVCESMAAHRLGGPRWRTARDWYADLWDSLNADRGLGWVTNPWCVAVTFTNHHHNIGALKAQEAA